MTILRMVLMALCSLFVMAAQGHSFWTNARLEAWLHSANVPEAVYLRQAVLTQAGKPLAWQEITGREETWRRLHHRPILTPRDPSGPFVRSVEFAVLVDRSRPLQLTAQIEWIRIGADGRLLRAPAAECWVRLKPAPESQVLPAASGQITVAIPPDPVCREAELTFRSGSQRHVLQVRLLNQKQPVTQE